VNRQAAAAAGTPSRLDADVVVAGSGAAGLAAAIAAHDAGARVRVVERAEVVGGTTAVSGGVAWIPMNAHMAEAGVADSREDALAYCTRLALGKAPTELIETFVDTAAEALAYLEERTPLRMTALPMPDYHAGLPGGKRGARSVEPELFDTNQLGAWRARLRTPSLFVVPLTLREMIFEYKVQIRPSNLPMQLVGDRMRRGLAAGGNALVGQLLKAVLEREIPIDLGTRARRLIMRDGEVCGIEVQRGGATSAIDGHAGVVLASGGFEWSDALQAHFLPGPRVMPMSPPGNEGDGLLMAAEAGAELANMSEVWGEPAAFMPGEMYDGAALTRLVITERMCPHAILVNAQGRRFVNEAAAYNEMNKAFSEVDANSGAYRNYPAWSIMDAQFRRAYPILLVQPGAPDPEWLIRAATLEELARRTGIDAGGLRDTVERWNTLAREGGDREFGRATQMGDVYAPERTIGTIEEPPFYALPVHPGTLGTKGGPRTDARARVLSVRSEPIPGLYAAGNVMAGTSGAGYYGAGCTIGLALTWGYIAGRDAASRVVARAK
jgi:succinate dehydrogenase/fumarate reductase flavoprotein subunit